ncbi:MAG TPA: hypothetical protein DDY13_04580 [Cytophagales bacterium]|jgi:hypothetical protein|nr:hypothetical protein [Cytophagales bacterium]
MTLPTDNTAVTDIITRLLSDITAATIDITALNGDTTAVFNCITTFFIRIVKRLRPLAVFFLVCFVNIFFFSEKSKISAVIQHSIKTGFMDHRFKGRT